MDVFGELNKEADTRFMMDQYLDNFFQDLESMWSDAGVIYSDPWEPPRLDKVDRTHPSAPPAPPSTPNKPRYRPPACPYARSIWDACGFRATQGERQVTIEHGLVTWAETMKCAYIGKDEQPWITWRVGSTPVSGKWSAFVNWFLCCCTKV